MRLRVAVWVAAGVTCFGRVYVGAHLPLDILGGAALGWAVGSFVLILVGAPAASPAPLGRRSTAA